MAQNRDTCLARKLHDLGIVHPNWTITLARGHHLDIALVASVLIQESGGGHNVFGHDPFLKPTRYLNWLKGRKVTPFRYRRYRAARVKGHGMQGVGPLQLTWYSIQDKADRAGGAHKPYINMDVGLGLLTGQIQAHDDLRAGVAAYNGTGQQANDYADQVLKRRDHIHSILRSCG
jgi:hypothetical protein